MLYVCVCMCVCVCVYFTSCCTQSTYGVKLSRLPFKAFATKIMSPPRTRGDRAWLVDPSPPVDSSSHAHMTVEVKTNPHEPHNTTAQDHSTPTLMPESTTTIESSITDAKSDEHNTTEGMGDSDATVSDSEPENDDAMSSSAAADQIQPAQSDQQPQQQSNVTESEAPTSSVVSVHTAEAEKKVDASTDKHQLATAPVSSTLDPDAPIEPASDTNMYIVNDSSDVSDLLADHIATHRPPLHRLVEYSLAAVGK
jgi:hypothetical protein